jgi:hypothetical protein
MLERAHLAEMMTSEKRLSIEDKLKAVEDLLLLCTQDLEVVHWPKEELVNGKCLIKSCQLLTER